MPIQDKEFSEAEKDANFVPFITIIIITTIFTTSIIIITTIVMFKTVNAVTG